ncbi:MAG: hypothetical protein R3D99_01565 [Altererythrobacter sp.]
MIRAVLALAALLSLPATALAQDDTPPVEEPLGEIVLDDLPPPGRQMIVTTSEGQAADFYPAATILPETAWVCVPEGGGAVTFRRADGSALVVVAGECAGGEPAAPPDGEGDETPGTTPDEEGDAGPVVVLRSSGPDTARFPPGMRLPLDQRVCIREASQVTILASGGTRVLNGPGCFMLDSSGPQPQIAAMRPPVGASTGGGGGRPMRPRTGAVRGAPPAYMRVIRGSKLGLAFYPVGSRLATTGRICLPPNAGHLTFQREAGGLVTYGDGGCNKVIPEPKPGEGDAGAGSGP